MDDLISRQAAIDVLAAMQGRCTSKAALIQNSKIWQQIKDLPAVEPERKRGYWKEHIFDGIMGGRPRAWVCDNCNGLNVYKTDFCPNCGADMRKEKNNGIR